MYIMKRQPKQMICWRLRVPEWMLKNIRAMAKNQQRSTTDMGRILLARALDQKEKA